MCLTRHTIAVIEIALDGVYGAGNNIGNYKQIPVNKQ